MKPVYKSKKKYDKLLEEQVEELSSLQRLHYASNRYAVLLIFQAMDAAGKDENKENARLIISEIILDIFNGLKWLTPSPGRTALDMQSACEVKPYLDENRRERKMLGERRFD